MHSRPEFPILCDLHDVVAHALSAMTVQATAARRLALTRPEFAREAFGAVAAAGREALDDLRRLGVVREGGETRELHELLGRSMSVMVLQAGGAQRILDGDPGRALQAATQIERTGREALKELRHLLGLLHEPGAAPLAPQPALAEVGERVAREHRSGPA